MRIVITAKEALDAFIWEEFCDVLGLNYYAVNEGMDEETEFSLTKEQAKELGFI